MNEPCGYLRQPYNPYGDARPDGHEWVPCRDQTKLLEADDEDICYATDREELLAELARRHPDVSPQYGVVVPTPQGARQYDEPVFRGTSPEEYWSRYSDADYQLLFATTRQHKKVRAVGSYSAERVLASGDCYSQGLYVRYSAKTAATRRHKRDTALFTKQELDSVTCCLVGLLPSPGQSEYPTLRDRLLSYVRDDLGGGKGRVPRAAGSLTGAVRLFLGRVTLLEALLGAEAVRRSEPVQRLLEAWRRNPEGNEQKYQAGTDGVEFVGQVRAWLERADA